MLTGAPLQPFVPNCKRHRIEARYERALGQTRYGYQTRSDARVGVARIFRKMTHVSHTEEGRDVNCNCVLGE